MDLPGFDTATLGRRHGSWQLSGVAVFAESQNPCRLNYDITCDEQWFTRRCSVSGYIGTAEVHLDITRSPLDEWTIGDAALPSLKGCHDIDLAFTPATNILPIRRLELPVGASETVRAAWLRFPDLDTEVLEQVYARVAGDRYLYESAGGAFRRELTVDASGFVSEYPGLWHAEARTPIS